MGMEADKPAEIGDHPRVAPLVEHADEEEEAARAHAVVEHLVDASLQALHIEGEHAEHHVAQVAHAREGDEPLHVGLHHADDGAVDDADDRRGSR